MTLSESPSSERRMAKNNKVLNGISSKDFLSEIKFHPSPHLILEKKISNENDLSVIKGLLLGIFLRKFVFSIVTPSIMVELQHLKAISYNLP